MRIIGIKLLKTKWHTVNRILKPDWYPFGDFPEPLDMESYSLPKRSPIEMSLYDIHQNNPHIEVCCLVGMNGSGKSTLLDILYRLINNFAYVVLNKKGDFQQLEYADGLNADLYYELDSLIYRIRCREKKTEFFVLDKHGYFQVRTISDGDSVLFKEFFYTISINYSLYSLNENEYEEDIEDESGNKESIKGGWIPHLFHQNNGYLTPIVVTPSRECGSINVAKENRLSKQRVITMGILSVAQAGPDIIDGYKVKSVKYKLNRHYMDSISNHYPTAWRKHISNADLDLILNDFRDIWENKLSDKLNPHKEKEKSESELLYVSRKKLILDYLAYKSLKICTTYEEYRRIFETESVYKECQSRKHFVSGATVKHSRYMDRISSVVDYLCNHQFDSHVNLKIRQCLNYIDSEILWDDSGEVEMSQLLQGKSIRTINDAALLLLPPFIDVDLILENKQNNERVRVSDLSSGERQILFSLGNVMYHLMNIQSINRYNHLNLVFDEAELYYHPEYQRQFIKRLIDCIARCNLDKGIISSISVIIATHSPFVLSDILTSNALYLSEGSRKMVVGQTFGANYYDMLQDSFFFEDSAIGELATYKIDGWIKNKNRFEGCFDMDEDTLQSLIGDPLIVNYLLSSLRFGYVQNTN